MLMGAHAGMTVSILVFVELALGRWEVAQEMIEA